ncbi:TrmH family RNA methyltransferase [Bacillus sp. PS06]|uniref:TrmH family RNA methyltransferase n=1 Tax=Bacillus sp. PS06 TaxID=2764176 RepID=UPI001780518C|nr:RNA methyltransferase [Bacillus sp. PS06]MBD8068917.1 RNA methyltransferase [Bacillus sp. PS06]
MKRIESIKNPLVKQWKKLQTKKERDRSKSFLIEGFHLVEEALGYQNIISELIISEHAEIPSRWQLDDVMVRIVTDEIMKEISETETTQGIVAVCKQRDVQDFQLDKHASKLLLIDAVQDPGNLGTLIRTAEAAGIDAVIIGDGTVDVYNSKVIRSTQGAIFHLPIIKGNLQQWIDKLKEESIPVYGTALLHAVPYQEVSSSQVAFGLIVGNEGNGVNKELLKETTQNLYIPIYGKSESLNVAIAAAILLYHLR